MCAHVGAGAEGLVGELFDGYLSGPNKKRMAQILGQYQTDEGMGLLLDRLGRKYVGPAVLEAMALDPGLAYRHLARRAAQSEAVAELLRDHLRAHPDLSQAAGDHRPEGGSGDGGPDAADGGPVGGDRQRPGEAWTDELPAVPIDPPWTRPRPRRRTTVPAVASPTTPTRLTWYPGEREQWLAADTYRPWLGDCTWARGERVLRALADRGHRDTIVAAAQHLGTAAGAAVTTILDADALLDLPPRVPELPSWANPALLPPVLLNGTGRALSERATGHLCTMLAISRPGDPYPGIDLIRAAVDARSVAVFA